MAYRPQPGKGSGYIVRNDRPPRQGQDKAPFLTGKITVVCPVSQVATEYWLDAYDEKKDGRTIYKTRLNMVKPKATQQQQGQAATPPPNRPSAPTAGRPGAATGRPATAGARPGAGGPVRPGGG